MNKIFIAVIFLLLTLGANSQPDSLIFDTNVKEPRSKTINDTRALLLDKFIEKDYGRVKVVRDYLLGFDNEDYIALYPAEFWLLAYWTKEYDAILMATEAVENKQTTDIKRRIPPKDDFLGIKLVERSVSDSSALIQEINQSSQTPEEKIFLQLLFRYLTQKELLLAEKQENFNNWSDAFLQEYPQSRFAPFVKKYIRNKYVETGNGIGYSFYSGTKIFGGLLGNHYKNPVLLGLSMDYLHQNWYFSFNILVGFTKTKETLTYPFATWNSGSKATEGCIELLSGYNISKSDKALVVPYLAAGIWGISPNDDTQKYPELKKAGVKTVFAPTAGVFTDIKLSKNKKTYGYYWAASTRESVNLRIGYGFTRPLYAQTPIGYSGGIHRLTLGISLFQRKMKRAE